VDESIHRERSDVASVMAVGAWRRF
jgi:hypothetical protein